MAFKDSFTYTQEELENLKVENDKRTEEVLKEAGIENVRPLTDEEEKELVSGNISEQDAVDLVLGKKTINEIKNEKDASSSLQNRSEQSDSQQPGGAKTPDAKDSIEDNPKTDDVTTDNKTDIKTNDDTNKETDEKLEAANEEISNLIGKIYVLKSQYTAELSNLENWVISSRRALSKEEKAEKLSPAEQEIGRQMYAKAAKLESDCDTQIKSILSELKTLLEQTGQDTSIVSQIRKAYDNEKQIMKSYYISTYRK